jgi:hypothetical protein
MTDNSLQSLQFQGIAGRHHVIVVYDFDEGLYFAAFLDPLLAHALCHFGGVAFDAGDEGVGEGMCFRAGVLRLDYYDLIAEKLAEARVEGCLMSWEYLFAGIATSCDDGHTANLHDYGSVSLCIP